MQGFYGGFEYEARERRRELLEEAQNRRLARLARPSRGLRERLAPALRTVAGLLATARPRVLGDPAAAGGVPDFAYLASEFAEEPGTAVEVYLGGGGCVVRRTDLRTGASTDSFVADGPVRR